MIGGSYIDAWNYLLYYSSPDPPFRSIGGAVLARLCLYGALHDEMIRGRIVVRLLDHALLEYLQLDSDLTLEKAVKLAQQSEAVKKQQPVVRGLLVEETMVEQVQSQRNLKGGH